MADIHVTLEPTSMRMTQVKEQFRRCATGSVYRRRGPSVELTEVTIVTLEHARLPLSVDSEVEHSFRRTDVLYLLNFVFQRKSLMKRE